MDAKDSVITLQLGHYANHVGAHFWNTQEAGFVYADDEKNSALDELEINHGVLFREGRTRRGEVTFTPRLVSVDLKNALGSMPVHGDLYEPRLRDPDQLEGLQEEAGLQWGGDVHMTVDEDARNEYLKDLDDDAEVGSGGGDTNTKKAKTVLDLESQVRVWSDYLRTRYHPRTNVVVQDYQHGDFTVNPFDTYGLGYNAGADLMDEIEDRVRYFAEESDSLQGFHLLADAHSGFGGLSVRVGELLSESYSSKAVLAFPVTPSLPDMTEEMRASGLVPAVHCLSMFLNGALTVHGLSGGQCGLTTPLSVAKETFPLLKTGTEHVRALGSTTASYQPQLAYHSSAVLASVLDTLTLPWRSYNGSAPMASLAHELNRGGRSLASVAATMPIWKQQQVNTSLVELLCDLEAKGLSLNGQAVSLTPGCHDVSNKVDTQIVSLRGVQRSMVSPHETVTGKYAKVDQVGIALFKHYDSRVPTRSVFSVRSPLPLKCPFPDIFVDHNSQPHSSSISAMALWQSSELGIGQTVKSLAGRAGKVNLNKLPKFMDCGLEQDTLVQTVEELTQLSECYKVNNGY